MKIIGNIVHIANSGKLIGRSSQSPPIGVDVYNKNKNKIGKIYNIFGPTKNPYISIRLKNKEFKYNVNDELFISKFSKDKRGRKSREKKQKKRKKN
jgi:RNA-binding protein